MNIVNLAAGSEHILRAGQALAAAVARINAERANQTAQPLVATAA